MGDPPGGALEPGKAPASAGVAQRLALAMLRRGACRGIADRVAPRVLAPVRHRPSPSLCFAEAIAGRFGAERAILPRQVCCAAANRGEGQISCRVVKYLKCI